MNRTATISECGMYRYTLTRRWGKRGDPECVFIMLNPSIADAEQDDPTIRRCIGFAKREGGGALTVLNLFAFRATSPKDMKSADDPVGCENDLALRMHRTGYKVIIAAWGTHGSHRGRSRTVMKMLQEVPVHCLGTTADGSPRHPLYVKADQPLVPFNLQARRAESRPSPPPTPNGATR